MAEAAGLAVGIIGLASLFNNAVDCFEYVQLGRNFSTDFQTSVLKLDNARLRLSRWGQAVGLSDNIAKIQSLQATALPIEDMPRAERLLGQILDLFADAEGVSLKFKNNTSTSDTSLAIFNVQADMDPVGRSLHEKMRELSIKRQNGASLRQKMKWALYEEKHFKRLIEDVIDLVDDLVEVFPAARQTQLELCEIEAAEVANESLPMLQDIAASQDKDLETVISNIMKSNVSLKI